MMLPRYDTVHDEPSEGYIVEFISAGKSVKVTAFDPVTLCEAVVVGSPRASRKQLTQLAVRKLEYILRKNKKETDAE